jgi:hypothetical protein
MLTAGANYANNTTTMKFIPHKCGVCGTLRKWPDHADLKHIRVYRRGLGLREFARMYGLSPAYICDIEKGTRRCTDRILEYYLNKGGQNETATTVHANKGKDGSPQSGK